MDIDVLMKKIIPPATREDRENFSDNKSIIDSLSYDTKKLVEEDLIEMVLKENYDPLILDTLVYLKSQKASSILSDKLINIKEPELRIKIASTIYLLNPTALSSSELESIAISSFYQLKDRYQIALSFYDLVKFKNQEMIDIIKSNQTSEDYHISYHANSVLSNESD